jgi:hypothetical protein
MSPTTRRPVISLAQIPDSRHGSTRVGGPCSTKDQHRTNTGPTQDQHRTNTGPTQQLNISFDGCRCHLIAGYRSNNRPETLAL